MLPPFFMHVYVKPRCHLVKLYLYWLKVRNALQAILLIMLRWLHEFDRKMNRKKIEVVGNTTPKVDIQLADVKRKQTRTFKYLGSRLLSVNRKAADNFKSNIAQTKLPSWKKEATNINKYWNKMRKTFY